MGEAKPLFKGEAVRLAKIGVPAAVIRGVDRLYDCTRKKYQPRIAELTRLTAVDVMNMESVGWTKLQETRRVLAAHGYRLRLDPPLESEDVDPDAPGELTAAEISKIRRKLIAMHADIAEMMHVLAPSESPDLPAPAAQPVPRPPLPSEMPRSLA
ncbi:hypothetical protein SEA_SOOS_72 [Gordonia phage Soos]|nr:hypothetical protein SEA_SOOS_72 [Gordonia phage Soos]